MRTLLLFVTLTIISACGNDQPDGCTVFVEPSDDDQTALQTALINSSNGDTVCFGTGTFTLTDPLEVSNLMDFTLRGVTTEETVLDFSGQETGGNGVQMMGMTNVTVEELTIREAAGNGLQISASDGVTIRNVFVGWSSAEDVNNGRYAIYPVNSSNVLIEDSETVGASDAGFYMGQTENCIMRRNVARGNVAAFEVENTVNCEVHDNVAEGNVGGILVFELPGLPMTGMGTSVHDNEIVNNNLINFAEEGTIVALLPSGTGVFVLAANDVEVTNNTITGNQGAGAVLISWGTVVALADGDDPPESYDPWMEQVYVEGNTFGNNGTNPGGMGEDPADPLWAVVNFLRGAGAIPTDTFTLEDVLWDGLLNTGASVEEFCLQNNGSVSFRNLDVGGNFTGSTTDSAAHDCVQTLRSPVDLPFEGG